MCRCRDEGYTILVRVIVHFKQRREWGVTENYDLILTSSEVRIP